jgi:hypothetical protein
MVGYTVMVASLMIFSFCSFKVASCAGCAAVVKKQKSKGYFHKMLLAYVTKKNQEK